MGDITTEKVPGPVVDETIDVPEQTAKKDGKPHRKWWHVFSYKHTHLATWQWAVLCLSLLLMIAGGMVGAYKIYQQVRKTPAEKAAAVVKKTQKKPTTEPSHLTGLQVDPALNQRPVTGVMIENSPDARPQSGLRDAGIVFEAIAEGGITRFLALFQESQPDYIGPVRSARPYYLDWLQAFDASLAHVGGSPDALSQIKSQRVKDLDEFANSGGYMRVRNRFAPHNVYTTMSKLDGINQKRGYTSSSFTSWPRKNEKPLSTPNARVIDFSISSYLYNVHYDYDASNNDYKRSEGGKAHKDERSGAQLSPKVVIALVLSRRIAGDGIHSVYTTTGSGHMYVFQDGTVTEGSWHKADRKAQFTFTDSNGATLALNPGQTWVSIVSSNSTVSYKP